MWNCKIIVLFFTLLISIELEANMGNGCEIPWNGNLIEGSFSRASNSSLVGIDLSGWKLRSGSATFVSINYVIASPKGNYGLIMVYSGSRLKGEEISDLNLGLKPLSHFMQRRELLVENSILLVGDGYESASLIELASRLDKSGIESVQILDGGLNALLLSSGLNVKNPEKLGLNYVDAKSIYPELRYSHWVILDLGDYRQIGELQGEEQKAQLKRLYRKSHNNHISRILIMTEKGHGYDRVEKLVDTLGWEHVFYLTGGKEALDREHQFHTALRNRKTVSNASSSCGGRV